MVIVLAGVIPAGLLWSLGWSVAEGGTLLDLYHKAFDARPAIESLVDPNDPHVVKIAEAIRGITAVPLEQLSIVDDSVADLIDQSDDLETWGALEHFASVAQIEENRRRHGWTAWRDDCDGKAVLCASVLQNLGYTWRLLRTSDHVWVGVELEGRTYEINPLVPTPNQPPRTVDLKMLRQSADPAMRERFITVGILWPDEPDTPPGSIRPRAGQNLEPTRSDLPKWLGGCAGLLWLLSCLVLVHRTDRTAPRST
jgi:hypothetical protein